LDKPVVHPDASDGLARLLQLCAQGDRNSLRAIYERESAAMIGVATRIVRRRELAEEIAHDVFVQIWRHAKSFDPALGSARGWIFAIVRNRAISALRTTSRELPTADEELTAAVDRGAESENAFDKLAEGSALKRCLEKLEPRRRLGVLLAYVEGLSHGEIAGRLGVPLGTAKSWLHRSLAQLRECLA
jgi:RNA polymerase sigma-70 factor (ECF subfamily)